jgi:hypothetical protein
MQSWPRVMLPPRRPYRGRRLLEETSRLRGDEGTRTLVAGVQSRSPTVGRHPRFVDLPGVAPGLAPCRGAMRPLAQARTAPGVEPGSGARLRSSRTDPPCTRGSEDSGIPQSNVLLHPPLGALWTWPVTLRRPLRAGEKRCLQHKPADPAGNAPASTVLEAVLALRLGSVALPTGLAPVSTGRQPVCDTRRIRKQAPSSAGERRQRIHTAMLRLLAASRTRTTRLGNERRDPPGRGDGANAPS